MQVSEATIIRDVRVAIDENTKITPFTDDDGNVVDTATLEMEDIIKSKITDGINAVRKIAPLQYLEPARKASGEDWPVTWTDEEKGTGEVTLPDDYLRMVMFKMSDWAHAVTVLISPESAMYHQQFSDIRGVRGNASRPVAALGTDMATGKKVIQFFSCNSTDAKAELTYIIRCDGSTGSTESSENTESAGTYEVERGVYRAVILKIASLVAATYGNGDVMNLMNGLAQEQFTIHNA